MFGTVSNNISNVLLRAGVFSELQTGVKQTLEKILSRIAPIFQMSRRKNMAGRIPELVAGVEHFVKTSGCSAFLNVPLSSAPVEESGSSLRPHQVGMVRFLQQARAGIFGAVSAMKRQPREVFVVPDDVASARSIFYRGLIKTGAPGVVDCTKHRHVRGVSFAPPSSAGARAELAADALQPDRVMTRQASEPADLAAINRGVRDRPHRQIKNLINEMFAHQARLPPSGAMGFDPRLTPAWAGVKIPN